MAAEAPPGDERALPLARLGWVTAHARGLHAAAEVFAAARAEEPRSPALRIEIEQGLAWCIHSSAGRGAAAAHAHAALALAEELGDPAILAGALTYAAFMDSLGGRGIALDRVERAERLGGPSPPWSQIIGRPDWIHALLLQWHGDLAGARARFAALRRRALDQGDVHALPFITFQLARVELQARRLGRGRGVRARVPRGDGPRRARRRGVLRVRHRGAGRGPSRPRGRGARGDRTRAGGRRGRRHRAGRARAARGARLPRALARPPRQAAAPLDAVRAGVEQTDLREPALFRFHGDAIEVDVALGRRDAARALIEDAERGARALDREWLRSCRARPRAARRGRGRPGRRAAAAAARRWCRAASRPAVRAGPHAARAGRHRPPRAPEGGRPRGARTGARGVRELGAVALAERPAASSPASAAGRTTRA